MSGLGTAIQAFGIVAITYFIALNASYLALTIISWRSVIDHHHRSDLASLDEAFSSPLTPPVSVLIPAYDEQEGIVATVRSLLTLRYPRHEVVVIDDGSTDETLERLQRAFDLVPVRLAMRRSVEHLPVREAYVSRVNPSLTVVTKLNGGKADALNCGLAASRFPYVCAVDADTVMEEDALLRVARPILDDPEHVVATGGIVRIANGCRIEDGRVVEVGLPKSRLATLQIVEYFRAFLVGRVAWSRLRSLMIISGAFGLFHRETVEAVGGYWHDTVGEDAELVVRIHRYMRDRDEEYRIEFIPDPVCWTEVPETLSTLSRQRRRWQRGLAETMWRHRAAVARRRYGALGVLGMPFYITFELLGPLIEVTSYVVLPIAAALGLLSIEFLIAFLLVSVLLGMVLSIASLALEEFSFRRHRANRDAGRLLLYSFLENLGYRQLVSALRVFAFWELATGRRSWGEMHRVGLERDLAYPDDPDDPELPAATLGGKRTDG